jgi:cytochrome P450
VEAPAAILPPRAVAHELAVLSDPYPAYSRLRQVGPLCRGGPAQWLVTRYADVSALLTDPRLAHEFPEDYHRFSAGEGPLSSFFDRIILDRDRPGHTRLRRLMGQAFSPGLARAMRLHITTLVDELLAPLLAAGTMDAVTDIAFPLPVMVVCQLLGISADDRDEVRPHAINLGKAFAAVVPERERETGGAAVTWLRAYIEALIDERRASPGDDLLSRMLAAEDAGERLSHEEIVDNAVFLFFAGFETTTSLIATGCAALLDHPAQLARLRANPALVPAAVEEFLRYDAPVQFTARLAREPIEIGERTIKAGRVLVLMLGSANHDQARFRDPDGLDVGRDPNPHLSFGGGIHYCLGAALARIEGAVVFDRLLRRCARFEPAGSPVRSVSASFRSYASVPVRLR